MKSVNIGRLLGCLGLALVCQRPAVGENPPIASPAAGACDSPYPDAQGNVMFACRGLNDEQIRMLPAVSTFVGKLLQSGIDGARLDSQTGEILKILQPGAEPKSPMSPTDSARGSTPREISESKREIITYDYRGYKTSSLTGLVLGDEGESQSYQRLLTLQKAGEWKKLLKESSREIKKVPDWLTPYAFKGVALQHLGNTKEAIESLEYVTQRSAGNPDYNQVRKLLQQLKPADH